MHTDHVFNLEGNLLEQRHRNPDGSRWSILCRYDSEGRIVEKEHVGATLFSYSYDSLGRFVRVLMCPEEDGERVHESFQYAEDGTKMQSSYPIPLSAEAGISAACMLHVSTDTVVALTIFDSNGRPTRKVLYDANDRVIRRIGFRHDARGLLLEEGELIGGRINDEFRNLYRYDDLGRKVESEMRWGDWGGQITHYAYNERGDVREQRLQQQNVFDRPASEWWSQRFRYEYDKVGNWIERVIETVRSNEEITASIFERRKIVYF